MLSAFTTIFVFFVRISFVDSWSHYVRVLCKIDKCGWITRDPIEYKFITGSVEYSWRTHLHVSQFIEKWVHSDQLSKMYTVPRSLILHGTCGKYIVYWAMH